MRKFYQFCFIIIILFFTVFMVINPEATISAASSGFVLWYSIILPALLPFFIVSEILIKSGAAKVLGIILEPIMRPIFRLPGCSAIVIAMGFTSGFPIGAVLSKRLFEEKLLTNEETERLVSFTNNSSPLFIIGAVGVGMLGSAQLGYLLAISHYTANLLVGFLWRFRAPAYTAYKKEKAFSVPKNLYNSITEISNHNKTAMGQILGEAIKNSISNILAISGFIIFFSVLARMMTVCGIMDAVARFFTNILFFADIPYHVGLGMGMGILEISIGIKTLSTAPGGEIVCKLLAASSILAFSGFSIIFQVMSILVGTQVRFSFYMLSRFVQMGLSLIITYIGYKYVVKTAVIPSFYQIPFYKVLYSFDAWNISLMCLFFCLAILAFMILLSFYRNS